MYMRVGVVACEYTRAVCADVAQMERDLESTNRFDSDTGAKENEGKRQVWRKGEGEQVEHIGILAYPDDTKAAITPSGAGRSFVK